MVHIVMEVHATEPGSFGGDELYDALPLIWQFRPESRKRHWATKFEWQCRLRSPRPLTSATHGEADP